MTINITPNEVKVSVTACVLYTNLHQLTQILDNYDK